MAKKRLLVLCVDRDNDLKTKARISGPVIGKEANLAAASRLALADPEETDGNTIFAAIKVFDELRRDNEVQIATLTGDKRLGYTADKEIIEQLENVLATFPTDSCVFVSDGASDEQIIPLLQSRIKIDSMKVVVMKQSKELEKTYFVLLEKLKEPHYARIVFGVPALFLVLLVLGDALGVGWRLVAIVLGLYLLLKGFGIEEWALNIISGFRPSVERITFISYLIALPLVLASLWMGFQKFVAVSQEVTDVVKIVAHTLRTMLMLLPWAVEIVLLGKVVDLIGEKKKYEIIKYGLYAITVFIIWLIFTVASDWVLADAYFSEFVIVIVASVILALVSIKLMGAIRIRVAGSMKLESKEVLSEIGAYIGKVVGVDRRKGAMLVQTAFGQKLSFPFESILTVGDKIMIRY